MKLTALLASPIYTGQAQVEEEKKKKNMRRGAKIEPLSSFESAYPLALRMYFSLIAK